MSRPALRDAPSDVPRDTYPVVRITGEFFLRGIDLLTHIQSGGLVSGLIFMVVWYAYLRDPAKPAIATREIARRLAMPYETIRRHALALERAGICKRFGRAGLVVPSAVHRDFAARAKTNYGQLVALLAELRQAGLQA